ncbi:hypothetical protein NDU88_006249 [Pleurodeles waltl]|uniref:Uncharacterized protein n=1 Tax=Pleurodeles waltl TaxID=8319 RepID=A0AAV7RPQ7_PLEWA|nr:hypothetical protein NDU88_006249 [Pleurodeles waltl]
MPPLAMMLPLESPMETPSRNWLDRKVELEQDVDLRALDDQPLVSDEGARDDEAGYRQQAISRERVAEEERLRAGLTGRTQPSWAASVRTPWRVFSGG